MFQTIILALTSIIQIMSQSQIAIFYSINNMVSPLGVQATTMRFQIAIFQIIMIWV